MILPLHNKYYFLSLPPAILLYFAAIRIIQNFLYRGYERPENLFGSLGPLFSRPEPLEMPLYLLGIIVIPFLAFALLPLTEKLSEKWKYLAFASCVGAFLAGFYFLRTADLGLYFDYIDTKGIARALWLLLTKRIYVAYLLFAASAAALVVFYFRTPALAWVQKYRKGSGKIFEVLFILLIAFLIFHPNLPTQDHHHVYFIGPINDHLHGKPLLYETSHLYGLLDAYFLVFIFKAILPFSYASFSLVIFLFYFGFFASLYYFLKSWIRHPALAAVCVTVLMAVMYFFNTSPTRSVYIGPATTPFRFWLYLPILFLLLSYQNSPKRIKQELALLLAAAAMFWNFDSGSFIAAATVLTFWYYEKFSFTALISLGARFFGYVAAIFALISSINFAVYGEFPNWALFFKEFHQFRAGIGMTPLPIAGVFELFFLVYLAAALWLLRQHFGKLRPNLVLFFLAVHGIFALLYYVGESSWQNLTIVSFPVFLVGIYLFQNFFENKLARAVFCAVLVYAGLLLALKIPVEFQNRDYRAFKSLRMENEFPNQDLYADALELKQTYADIPRLAILHQGDTRIMPFLGKPNFFDFYYLFTLYYREDVEREVERLKNEQPKYLFVGRQRDDRMDHFMSLLPPDYEKTRQLRTLDVYERK